MSDPRVLFLDEPTSGLDSYTANEVLHLSRSHVLSRCTSSVALEKHVVRLSSVRNGSQTGATASWIVHVIVSSVKWELKRCH